MTNEEDKEAFVRRKPVTYGGREYDCIHAIITATTGTTT